MIIKPELLRKDIKYFPVDILKDYLIEQAKSFDRIVFTKKGLVCAVKSSIIVFKSVISTIQFEVSPEDLKPITFDYKMRDRIKDRDYSYQVYLSEDNNVIFDNGDIIHRIPTWKIDPAFDLVIKRFVGWTPYTFDNILLYPKDIYDVIKASNESYTELRLYKRYIEVNGIPIDCETKLGNNPPKRIPHYIMNIKTSLAKKLLQYYGDDDVCKLHVDNLAYYSNAHIHISNEFIHVRFKSEENI